MKSTLCRTYFKCIRRDLHSTFALGLSLQPTNLLLPVRIVKFSASGWFPNKQLADTLVTPIFQNVFSDGRSRRLNRKCQLKLYLLLKKTTLLSFSCHFQERPQLKKKEWKNKKKRYSNNEVVDCKQFLIWAKTKIAVEIDTKNWKEKRNIF